MVHHDTCPVCSSGDIQPYLKSTDYFLSGEVFALVKCPVCGIVFTQDYPAQELIGKYYESDAYLSHNDSVKGFSNSLYRLSRRLMLRKKRALVKGATGMLTGNLLDIGSGSGHFPAEMRKAGWRVTGIEINDGARDYSISRFGLNILSPDQIHELLPAEFDCITMWHVLEHFLDPFNYASEVFRLLKPGGICIVALPNCSSFDAHHYGKFWAGYDVPRHLWHFTPATFHYFAGIVGFEIKETGTLPLDVFYISALSEKYKGSELHFIKGIIKGFWFSLQSCFNRNRSSSMIYLIRKKNSYKINLGESP